MRAQLGVDSIRSSTAAGSGHPTSSLSAAHLAAVLWSDHLRYDVADPKGLANDRFVLSKGHASPLMFSVLKAVGAIGDEQLLSFRRFGSPVQGHPVPLPDMPWIDVATGSLGQGLPIALGMALAMRMDGIPARVWCLMGDSEVAEGSVWEAMENASYHGADNLIAIVDVNRLGQRGPTMLEWDLDDVRRSRASRSAGTRSQVDGHDVAAIDAAFAEAEQAGRPAIVIAQDREGSRRLVPGEPGGLARQGALAGGGGASDRRARRAARPLGHAAQARSGRRATGGRAERRAPRRTRRRSRRGRRSGRRSRRSRRDRTWSRSTARWRTPPTRRTSRRSAPDRFVESYIAEQNMLGMAVGMQVLGKIVFAATFAAFLTRAYDFIRMAAISRANLRLCGSHAGVSIGEDGPSQMALEDLAMMRAVHGSTVLYPCDGNSTAALVAAMADLPGISYIRTTREKTPAALRRRRDLPRRRFEDPAVLGRGPGRRSSARGSRSTRRSGRREALAAEGIAARVIDCYSIKPIDAADAPRAASPRPV